MIYLIEPYNAHQKPPRKKHWMEIAEEEALHQRIALEAEARNQVLRQSMLEEAVRQHMALREASALKNNQNLALPQYAPQPSSQQIQDATFAPPAGGGAGYEATQAALSKSEGSEVASFTYSPSSAVGPVRVYFNNTSETPENDTFFWDFGTGSLTSNIIQPGSRLYTGTGSYTVTLQETSSNGAMSAVSHGITVLAPTPNPRFSVNISSSLAPFSSSFTNTSYPDVGDYNVLTYQWDFGDGTYFTGPTPPIHGYNTGSFVVVLNVTESIYGIKASYVLVGGITGSVPTLSPSFTADVVTGTAQLPVTFSNNSTQAVNVGDSFNYRWVFGDGAESSVFAPQHEYGIGEFPVRLEMSESLYKITAVYVLPGGITGSA